MRYSPQRQPYRKRRHYTPRRKRSIDPKNNEEDQAKEKIDNTTSTLMITVAVTIDTLQAAVGLLHFIPIIGTVIAVIVTTVFSVIAWLTFMLWFKIKGVDFVSPKRTLALNGGFLLELIPGLKLLPGWTLAVVMTIGTTKIKKVASFT